METKAEYRQREAAWKAAITNAPARQYDRVQSWIESERLAWGYKPRKAQE